MENVITTAHVNKLFEDSEKDHWYNGQCYVLTIKLKNGFMVTESTTCIDSQNADEVGAREIVATKIKSKLRDLESYRVHTELKAMVRN
ncbi:Gp49 family protein [Clostridium sp.]|uniref:Gp49 family protein n=1 Tax=Clostridium sp. TaxID=1506 RepID=UPI001A52A26C|nr:Gp49 family protein [Clostridium sp.]MBK5235378.1 hypothetical protein [Clostridium sp.]